MSARRFRLAVLISGGGTNLQALIDAVDSGQIDGQIALVVSNKRGAYGLQRATRAGIPTQVLGLRPYRRRHPERAAARAAYDADLARVVAAAAPDLIVLAGFMLILGPAFLSRFPDRVINLHPALPGELPGVDAIGRAYAEACAGRRQRTGVMVHRVVEEVDAGPVLGVAEVPIEPAAGREHLEARLHAAEHRLLVEVVAGLAAGAGYRR